MEKGAKKFGWEKGFFLIVVLAILGVVAVSFYLFLQFKTGDYVYNDKTGLVGEIKGISLPIDYLVQWQDGSLSKESLFNVRKLNELSDLEVLQLLEEEEKKPENYFYPGGLEEKSVDELFSISGLGASEVMPLFSDKGNFILMLGEEGCKPNFVCSDWGSCQPVYGLESVITEELVSGFQYRYCKDYSQCLSDFIDSKPCKTKIPITMKEIEIGDKDYMEIYDKDILVSRLSFSEEEKGKLDIQMVLDETAYSPYCYDGIKNFDEDEVDCVYEENGNCPVCEQEFYAMKGDYFLMLGILITLIILCLIFIVWFGVLRAKKSL